MPNPPLALPTPHKQTLAGIPFLCLAGDAFQTGQQYGSLMADELHATIKDFNAHLKAQLNLPGFFAPLAYTVVKKRARRMAERLSGNTRAHLAGMAQGSRIVLEELLTLNLVPNLVYGCCSFFLVDQDHVIHARNLDSPPIDFFGAHPAAIHVTRPDGSWFAGVGFCGMVWLPSGINSYGLTFSENSLDNVCLPKPRQPLLQPDLQGILGECRNAGDAAKFLCNKSIPFGYIFCMSDLGSVAATCFDAYDNNLTQTEIRHTAFIANRAADPVFRSTVERDSAATYHNTAREWRFEKLLADGIPAEPSAAIRVLRDSSFYRYGGLEPTAGIETINNPQTIQSVVIDRSAQKLYLAAGQGFAAWNEWLVIDLHTREMKGFLPPDPRGDNLTARRLVEHQILWDANQKDRLYHQLQSQPESTYFELTAFTRLALDRKDLKGAFGAATRLVEAFPEIAGSHALLAKVYFSSGDVSNACRSASRGLDCPYSCDVVKQELLAILRCAGEGT